MRISELGLMNFRNYTNRRIEPAPSMNVLIGPNAQGKSNLLEAVYVLTTTKSHRTNRDSDLIKVGENATRITCSVVREKQNDVDLEIILSRLEKKTVKINTVRHTRIADMIGELNSVIFSAEDLSMIKGEPLERRRFLNLEISQLSGQYVYAFAGYKRTLEQRNALLKSLKMQGGNPETLDVWDRQLAAFGSILLKSRCDFVKRLVALAGPIYDRFTDRVERLDIQYEPSIPVDEEQTAQDVEMLFLKALTNARPQELARGITLKGPHRDDIRFTVNDLDLRYYGSQGQQRSAALALKLAETQLVEETVGEPPVVMLDDVMAELDEKRREHVFDLTLGRCQTFASATSLDGFPNEALADAAMFDVRAGEALRR